MSKTIKRVMALVTAIVMVLAMAMVSNAATITINDNGNVKVADHTFEAYQIFSGTLKNVDGKYVLSDIVWGAGVDGSALLTALKSDSKIGSKFTNAGSAEDVAGALQGASADDMVAFSRVVAEHTTKAQKSVKGGTITDLADGYYFVKDTTAVGEGDAVSAFVVQLVGSAEVNIKTDAPEIEKKLKNHDELIDAYRDANNVGIGDIVDYRITSKVPNMENYKKYYFIVHDTLSAGLDFNPDSLAIKVGSKTLVADTDYEVTTTGKTEIEIVFKNFKQYAVGSDVEITYNATLNANAEVGVDGNPNEVYLEYSNNPNKEGQGEDKPGPEDKDVTGETPKDTVITYSTNLKVLKVDENGKALPGVKFTISGYAQNDKISYSQSFEEAENGEYWKLSDGTFTKTAPETLTQGKYDSTEKKYNLVVKKGENSELVTYAAKQSTSDKDGIIDIGTIIADGSLPAGTYVIHEDETVDGYNVLDHDIVVKVTAKVGDVQDINFEEPATTTKATWAVEAISGEGATVKEDGTIEITIENKKGSTLPSTGGMGTTIFYVIGGILVLAAVIVLISKRRVQQ